ncbi:MAG TPA: hypothetical protein VL967_07025 [Terracidiphilus sp.]|nr:hypothetical protein [Terracidiphilus sp.]
MSNYTTIPDDLPFASATFQPIFRAVRRIFAPAPRFEPFRSLPDSAPGTFVKFVADFVKTGLAYLYNSDVYLYKRGRRNGAALSLCLGSK